MDKISETKLAGLTLIFGPLTATIISIIFLVIPSLTASDTVDLLDWSVVANEQYNLELWVRVPLLLIPVLLTFSVFGFSVLGDRLEKFGHFFKAGMNFFVANIIISAAAWGVLQSIAWIGSPGWAMAVVSAGMASYATFLGSIGLLIISLSIAGNKNIHNQLFAYTVALFMILGILTQGIMLLDRTEFILNIANPLTAISYVVFSLWTLSLGLKLYSNES